MITKTSSSVNGVKLGFQYEGFEFSKDGTKARITKPRVIIIRDVNIVDHVNQLVVSGSIVVMQKGKPTNSYYNINCSGKGKKILKHFTGRWIDLDPDKHVRRMFNVKLNNIEWASQGVSLSGYIAYPTCQVNV